METAGKTYTFWVNDVYRLKGRVAGMSRKRAKNDEAGLPELEGMPERDECGKAAIAYLATLDEVADAKVHKEDAATKFITAMLVAKRTSVNVMGRVVSIRERAAEEIIKVTKPKEK